MLLEIKNLFFGYQSDNNVFEDLNFSIEEGQIIAIAGESGCGKSTLLSLIYGLYDWQSGDIIFDNQKLFGPKGNLVPGETNMKLVAQNYDLMPYATVQENVGKFISNINLLAKKEKINELLDVVGLNNFANVLPKNLSGGQQQRVAIARALAILPKLLLLDEPFSNLDFSRKYELRDKLFSYVKNNNLTLLISTHNLEEVLPWSDKVVIIKHGEIIQNATPKEIYENPKTTDVAKLLGEVNIFNENDKKQFLLSKLFYFPHQIKISENGHSAEVLESRYAGSHYRNKIKLENKKEIVQFSNNKLEDRFIKITFC